MLLMLAAVLLLPLALAGCPCPPAPAAAQVCGSDSVTYASQCHLDCAGRTAAHPGPCSALESAAAAVLSAKPVTGVNVRSGSARTPADDYQRLMQCLYDRGCPDADRSCSECTWSSLSEACRAKCIINCACGCYGLPGSAPTDDNIYAVTACFTSNNCLQRRKSCDARCTRDDCRINCHLAYMQCICPCNQLGSGSGSSTRYPPSWSSTPWPSGSSALRAGLVPATLALLGLVLVSSTGSVSEISL